MWITLGQIMKFSTALKIDEIGDFIKEEESSMSVMQPAVLALNWSWHMYHFQLYRQQNPHS